MQHSLKSSMLVASATMCFSTGDTLVFELRTPSRDLIHVMVERGSGPIPGQLQHLQGSYQAPKPPPLGLPAPPPTSERVQGGALQNEADRAGGPPSGPGYPLGVGYPAEGRDTVPGGLPPLGGGDGNLGYPGYGPGVDISVGGHRGGVPGARGGYGQLRGGLSGNRSDYEGMEEEGYEMDGQGGGYDVRVEGALGGTPVGRGARGFEGPGVPMLGDGPGGEWNYGHALRAEMHGIETGWGRGGARSRHGPLREDGLDGVGGVSVDMDEQALAAQGSREGGGWRVAKKRVKVSRVEARQQEMAYGSETGMEQGGRGDRMQAAGGRAAGEASQELSEQYSARSGGSNGRRKVNRQQQQQKRHQQQYDDEQQQAVSEEEAAQVLGMLGMLKEGHGQGFGAGVSGLSGYRGSLEAAIVAAASAAAAAGRGKNGGRQGRREMSVERGGGYEDGRGQRGAVSAGFSVGEGGHEAPVGEVDDSATE